MPGKDPRSRTKTTGIVPSQNNEMIAGHDLFETDKNGTVAAAEVANKLGVDVETAKSMISAVKDYTEFEYFDIRAVERGAKKGNAKKNEQIKSLNEYMSRAPKYDGWIFRGLNFKSEQERDSFVNSVRKGFASNSMDSWSSDHKVAAEFAGHGTGRKEYGVVIRTKNRSGVSVKQLSSSSYEDEVLVRRGANYRINSMKSTNIGNTNLVIVEVSDLG